MKNIILGVIALAAVVLAFTLGGLKAVNDSSTDTLSVVEIASSEPTLSTFAAALKAAGLDETLQGNNEYTIFAPNNDAFAKLPAGTLQNLLKPSNKDKLKSVLSYHIIPGKVISNQLNSAKVDATNGKKVDIKVTGDALSINNARVVKADIIGSNGVVYIIDSVLIPQ